METNPIYNIKNQYNMRKNHFLAAIGAMSLMLASCASDEPVASVNNMPENLIAYSTGISNQSRALNSYCANVMPESFNVWAHVGDDGEKIYVSGDEVRKTDEGYKATVDRYWPEEGETLSFFAYVDAGNTFKYNNGKPTFEDYTIKENAADQLDLMYAVTKDAANKQTVNLNFRHALAQVCYKAVNVNPNLSVTINSITVAGLADKGTYTFPAESTTTNYENHAGAEPAEELNRGTWVLDETRPASYEVNVGGVKLSDEVSNLTFPELDEEGTHTATNFSKVLALLPYDENATTAATVSNGMTALPTDGTYFILNLTVSNKAVAEDGTTVEYPLLDNKDFYVGASFDWKQGNRYTYTFKFDENWTPDNLEPIAYAVSVDDYINQNGGDIVNPSHWTDPFSTPKKVLMVPASGDQPAIYVADRNLGATSIGEYGNFYQWGSLEPAVTSTTDPMWVTGWNANDLRYEDSALYGNTPQKLYQAGFITEASENATLAAAKDAATQTLGEDWHIPTIEEWERFLDNTEYAGVVTLENGINATKYASKSNPEAYVLFPICGYRGSGGWTNNGGTIGEMWSSTTHFETMSDGITVRWRGAKTFHFGNSANVKNNISTSGHYSPHPIRPFSNTAQ